MRYIDPMHDDATMSLPTVELTRRNLTILLAKLDDPLSLATLVDGLGKVAVRAVEDDAHYTDRAAGLMLMPTSGEMV